MHKHFRLLPTALGLTAILALPACVTINIYFPEAAAEKAADKIINDVWQLQGPANGTQPADEAAPAPAQSEE